MCLLMSIGDMPHEHAVKSLEPFANEVMPNFRKAGAGTEPALATS